ncbi:CoA pyrophosphatase [bacterium]|nr:CoA pyrophosphatase [bacterium]
MPPTPDARSARALALSLRPQLPREGAQPEAGLLDAAVLVPLLDGGAGPALLFLRRAQDLPDHAGQVAFPGGLREAGDGSLAAAALREAAEEVAIDPARIELYGALSCVSTLAKYSIQPFLSLWPPGEYRAASPGEVARVFQVPLAWLADPASSSEVEIDLPGRRLRAPAWCWDEEVIWGATRRITLDLLQRLAAAGAAFGLE